jgi:hypothetical protein
VGARLGAVEHAQRRRRRLLAQGEAHRGQRVVERGQGERGQKSGLGAPVDAQHGGGDEAEPSLATAQRARQVRTARSPRRDPGVHRPAVGQHGRDPEHRVLDAAVARRRLAGRAHGDEPADRRSQRRGREVAEREPARHQDALERERGQPGLDVDDQRGLVEVEDVAHPPAVDVQARPRARRPVARGGARAVADRDDGGPGTPGQRDDLRHLGRGSRLHHPGGALRLAAGGSPDVGLADHRLEGSPEILDGDRRGRVHERAPREDGRPSLPGFMMPSGSKVALSARRIAIASRCSPSMAGPLSRPTPW